ncbi:tRNA pseudouridine 13 synthase [Thermofilum adornatum 1505]|uniref:Probable tRNA pseudouridine synthase D n=1 Tax=Thermofilum adornatum 1505 TaxID=697581 RepID=A0A3G1A583_9CREN|nr:tRNA pseudouridine(13) synthase TruD [Thermofilum adornatum]AJB41083.1 tRNA pseudouridine 13 synthase [Thermofilum adornatum 1505]
MASYTRTSSDLDKYLGLEFYALASPGTGGRLKESLEDFLVQEVSIDGEVASPKCSYVEGGGQYTWLVLEKRKIDTVAAVKIVAKHFGLRLKDVGIAGLKDTNAVTYQFISLQADVTKEMIEEFNSKHSYIKLHCPMKRPFSLRPGLLNGNYFTIKVREVDCLNCLEDLVEELSEKKMVPNYYGYQRFGSIRPVTHIVGKKILKGEYKEAIDELLLRIFPGESENSQKARSFLKETGDYQQALEIFPKTLRSERTIIRYLAKHPGDYVGALRSISSYIKKLFIGAYQAYLFNRLLSKRMEYGLSYIYPSPGDSVGIFRSISQPVITGLLRVNETNVSKVREWIDRGQAALVLPVFGYRSQLSLGRVGDIEKELLREEEIDISLFRLKSIPEASSAGTYRMAALKPMGLEHQVFGNSYEIKFRLYKGMYATVLLREFIKPSDPAKQGF